jgi:biopolymer transport protein ExbD
MNKVVIIADKKILVKDINPLLTKLYKNNIKNIKLLSSRNGI